MTELIAWLVIFQHEILLFSAFWFLVGGIDDLIIDIIWLIKSGYRKIRYYHREAALLSQNLPPANNPGKLAIFIAAWQEESVISDMLHNCQSAWADGEEDYHIYIGYYPNDKKTKDAILSSIDEHKNLHAICCKKNGPTSKADCLNQLWFQMEKDELHSGQKYKAIILHDAEDHVHKDELKLFDRLIEKSASVQLPVIPLCLPKSPFISGHYCDEFAEAHCKTMVVREYLGVALPLAGVACAIDRNILGKIARLFAGRPFNEMSLTEDYELGHKIRAFGGKSMIARIYDDDRSLVATKAYFPHKIADAIRQKTRWTLGIALSGWDNVRWQGNILQKWMLLRDRKAPFAALILTSGYLVIILTAILYALASWFQYSLPSIGGTTIMFLKVNAVLLIWRLIMRAAFTTYQYGVMQGMLSIPRAVISNIIAIIAARRACFQYARHLWTKTNLSWDKTTHTHFPHEDSQ